LRLIAVPSLIGFAMPLPGLVLVLALLRHTSRHAYRDLVL